MEDYRSILKELLHDVNYIDRDRFSKDDFVTIICPDHGVYYKTIQDILDGNPDCPICNYLNPSTMVDELLGVVDQPEQEVGALFYRIKVEHKKSGLLFQKIGIVKDPKAFDEFWNPWKWADFIITPITKIECSDYEAQELQRTFQEVNQKTKITIPNSLKFNINMTYAFNEIWQAKSKTIPILREIMTLKQKGLCTICDRPIKAPTLDHMHVKRIKGTGYIRAVCCSQCNTFIARSENNAARHGISNKELPDVLRRMATHLETQTNIIHPTEVPKRKKVGTREWNKVKKHYLRAFPTRRTIPDRPTYVTDKWLALVQDINAFLEKKAA